MEFYLNALSGVLTPGPIFAMVGATILGVFIGALPGLNPVMAIELLLPLTYSKDPLVALGMVAGIYNGSMYGGAIPAILMLNADGEEGPLNFTVRGDTVVVGAPEDGEDETPPPKPRRKPDVTRGEDR